MNDTPTAADLAAPTAPTKIVKDGYVIERVTYDPESDAAGFAFHSIEYTDVQVAERKLGKEAVLSALNSSLRSSLRTKGKALLSENKDKAARKQENEKLLAEKYTDGVLVTESEAENFVPGARGLTSPTSLLREAKLAKEEGRTEEAIALYKLFMEASQKEFADLAAALGKGA